MNWLKYLVGISAVIVAGCAAYFSVTGLGVLFAGASISVMVMAGALEFAKLVAATYLKQEWDTIKGFNKWYLATSVATLMLITSAGIFGYLSNAFQQQNLELQKVERDIAVYQTQITKNDAEIARYTTQLTNQQNIRNSQEANLSKQIDKDKSTSRVSQMIRTADKEIASVSKRIDELTIQNNVALDSINAIKNNNIELEREVGGFRFVAEAFNVPLNDVVKFFILIIVLVFDPLAVALIIAFNGLIMRRKEEDTSNKEYELYGDKKKQRDALIDMMKGDEELGLYDEPILQSEKDAEVFFNEIENPSEPNEVENFMQKTISQMKRTPFMDPQTGEYNLKYNLQNSLEDFFIPIRGNDTTTKIDTTKGLDYTAIDDVVYLRDKLFAALKVPKAFMGYEKDLTGKATLAAEDIRFARTINRIQRIPEVLQLILKVCVFLGIQTYPHESYYLHYRTFVSLVVLPSMFYLHLLNQGR